MKIGFSSAVCPGLDLNALLDQAQALGYKAVELQARAGDNGHLPASLFKDPAAIAAVAQTANVEVACLASGGQVGHGDRGGQQRHERHIRDIIAIASQLGCPYVTVETSLVPASHNRDQTLARVVASLRALAPHAAEQRVTLLVENRGTFVTSRDLWYILDAVGHPAVRCCWNPLNAFAAGDTHTLAVPRVGRQTAVTHLVDATLSKAGRVEQCVAIGQGQAELDRYLVLMHGIAAEQHLIVDVRDGQDVSSPREYLTAAKAWLDAELERIAQMPELSAYKGDKNAPRFTSPAVRANLNV